MTGVFGHPRHVLPEIADAAIAFAGAQIGEALQEIFDDFTVDVFRVGGGPDRRRAGANSIRDAATPRSG